MMQAVELQGKGQVAEAEHLFKGILNIDPNNVVSLYSLGVICLNRGQADEALRLSAHGIAASTEFAPVRGPDQWRCLAEKHAAPPGRPGMVQ